MFFVELRLCLLKFSIRWSVAVLLSIEVIEVAEMANLFLSESVSEFMLLLCNSFSSCRIEVEMFCYDLGPLKDEAGVKWLKSD
jgi:hypothetical protein